MEMSFKYVFSGLAIILTFTAFVPYIHSIRSGNTKPHVFSWVIWGTTTVIVFLAQLESKGGTGAWPTGVSGAITTYIAFLALHKRSDISITPVDWLFFTAALASLPFWYYTADPLWAVVELTIVDLFGFGPTLRKAYACPHEENIAFFILFITRNAFAILALQHYSLATVLFPLAVGGACLILLIIISYRRRIVLT
jgi:hypothetical protein